MNKQKKNNLLIKKTMYRLSRALKAIWDPSGDHVTPFASYDGVSFLSALNLGSDASAPPR